MRCFYLALALLAMTSLSLSAQKGGDNDGSTYDGPIYEEPDPFLLSCVEVLRTPLGSTYDVWDWKATDYTFYLMSEAGPNQDIPITRPSPWYPNINDFPVNMEQLVLGNQGNFDYEPSDGWELVLKSLGEEGEAVNMPFFVLTNRKTGITRGFFYISNNDGSYNTLRIGVSHITVSENSGVDGGSAVFNYGNDGLTLPVSEFIVTNESGFTSFNSSPLFTEHWALVQFPTYYDPCVCNSASQIKFYGDYSAVTKVTLSGIGEGESEAIYNKPEDPTSLITGLAKGVGAAQKGYKLYKDLDSLKKKLDGLEFLASALKWMPKVGTAIFLLDEFFGGSKESSPTLLGFKNTFEFEVEGNQTTSYQPQSGLVNTPGASHFNLNSQYNPIYDNPLGVFALLEKPVLEAAGRYVEMPEYPEEPESMWVREDRYKLNAESIKYAINPAAEYDLAPGSIKAGIVFTTRSWDLNNTYLTENATADIPNDGFLEVEYTTPLLNLECLEDYSVDFYHDYLHANDNIGHGQRVVSASIVIAVVGDDITGSLAPITIGRYPLEIERIGGDKDDLPENPYVTSDFIATPEEIEEQCTRPFLDPVSRLELYTFCKNQYDPLMTIVVPEDDEDKEDDDKSGNKENEGKLVKNQARVGAFGHQALLGTESIQELSVFPNPVRDQAAIRIAGSGTLSMQLLDINGKLLHQREIDLQDGAVTQQLIDVSTYVSGTYFIRLIGEDQLPKTQKLIVNH